jgi:arsenite oxidase large subunit
LTKTPIPPKDAQRYSTVCQFCIVGCGYRVFKWPEGRDGGAAPGDNALGLDFRQQQPPLGTWIAPAMHNVITEHDGQRYSVAIIPDDACQVNSGMASARGAGLAASLYRADGPTKTRLTTPTVRAGTTYDSASWDEASDLAARVVKAVIDRWGPDAVGMKFFDHGGGGGGFENNWAVGRFFFEGVQTSTCSIHNRPAYNSEVHAAGDAGLAPLTNAYIDAQLADTILIVGANPYETQTNYFLNHMVKNLSGESLPLKRSAFPDEEVAAGRIIIVDPRRTMTVAAAEQAAGAENVLHLQIEPGADLWVMNAIARIVMERKWHDVGFIRQHTETQTFDAYQRSSLMRDRPAEELVREAAERAGIPPELLIQAAEWIARPKAAGTRRRTLLHYEKGLIWGIKNYENLASIVGLTLLTGNVGKPGAGCSRLGGHQEGYVRPPSGIARPAYNIDEAVRRGETKVFWIGGCNPVLTTLRSGGMADVLEGRGAPVTAALAATKGQPVEQRVVALVEALKDGGIFIIAQDIYPTTTTERAHLVLPAAGWGEMNLTSINGERRLRLYQKFMDPPGEAIPDWKIIARVARRLNALYTAENNPEMANRFLDFDWQDDEAVFIDARYTFTGGPGDPMESYAGVNYALLRRLGANGIQTPVRLVRGTPVGTERLFEDKRFATPSGKARFIAAPPPWPGYAAEVMQQRDRYRFWINNGRSNHIWQTAYHHRYLEFYRERAPIPYLEMHPADAAGLSILPGDLVEVANDVGSVQAMAYPTDAVKRNHCFLLFGQPRGPAGRLVSDHVDPTTTVPWYKGVWADVRRIGPVPEITQNVSFKPQNVAE